MPASAAATPPSSCTATPRPGSPPTPAGSTGSYGRRPPGRSWYGRSQGTAGTAACLLCTRPRTVPTRCWARGGGCGPSAVAGRSWLIRTQDDHVGEQGARAPVGAHGDLRPLHLLAHALPP